MNGSIVVKMYIATRTTILTNEVDSSLNAVSSAGYRAQDIDNSKLGVRDYH